jgi:hypothetical protein
MDENILEQIYQEKLEERIIAQIAADRSVSLEKAMDIYYSSELADQIHQGMEGIQYLDYRVLAQLLAEMDGEGKFP